MDVLEMSDNQRDVRKFQKMAFKAGAKLQAVRDKPGIPPQAILLLGCRILLEETLEAITALGLDVFADTEGPLELEVIDDPSREPNLTEAVKELCDVQVMKSWLLNACGVADRLPQLLVDRSNIAKLSGDFSIREDGKVLKPSDWKAPEIEEEIERQQSL